MAGYELSDPADNANPVLSHVDKFSANYYGFNHFEFLNASHCKGRFINVNDTNGNIQDSFYVLNPYYYNKNN